MTGSSDSAAIEIVLEAPVEPAALPRVHDLIDQLWARQPGVASRDRMLFTTAVAEVASNIIKHRQGDAQNQLVLTLRLDPARIEAVFVDDGAVVEPGSAEDPPPDELAESGRGANRWHLVRHRDFETR
jgi:anti-sigma regulatory factor (Ser/Thr protein kinase)